MAQLRRQLIGLRKQHGKQAGQQHAGKSDGHVQPQELLAAFPGFLQAVGAQLRADQHGDCRRCARGQYGGKHIAHFRNGNSGQRSLIQPGIAPEIQVQAHAPQKLVGDQRRGLHKEGADGFARQAQCLLQVPVEIHPFAAEQHQIDQHFQRSGDQRAPRRACYAQRGSAQLAENQDVVAHSVRRDGTQTDQHGQAVHADGAQRKHAHIADGCGQIADADHRQIAQTQQNGVFILDKQAHDLPGQKPEQHEKRHRNSDAQADLQ